MKLRHPLVAVLAQWEDENGTMAAILPDEWMKLHAVVTQACIEESPRMLRAALAEPVADEPWPKLTKPARVGNGTFGVGVSSRLVVEAAQRQHEYVQEERAKTPEQIREHERNRRELWDMMNGPIDTRAAPAEREEYPPLPVDDLATPSGGREAGPEEERIEASYWRFDARHKGHGQWKQAPMSERDAFKAEMRNALEAEKVRAEMRLVGRGWRPVSDADRAQRVPLTDEQMAYCIYEARMESGTFKRDGTMSYRIGRAVERAHKIGAKP